MPHKFRIMRPPLAVGLALILCNTVFAQKPDLVPLNAGFAGTVVFKLDKNDRLVMDHFDQGGRIRQDIVRIEDLDPQAVTFSAEEQAVALKCLPEKAQCISKEIFKLDAAYQPSDHARSSRRPRWYALHTAIARPDLDHERSRSAGRR